MVADWYYDKNGQQFGPVSLDQLKELAAAGQLTASDLVFRQGMAHWTRAGVVRGIFTGATQARPAAATQMAPPTLQSVPADSTAAPPAFYDPTSAPAPMLDYSSPVARAGSVLAGFPPGTGSRDEWPLSPHHLSQLQLAEQHRKTIRSLASLLRMLFLLSLILGVIMLIAALGIGLAAGRGQPRAAMVLIPAGIFAALAALYYFAAKATLKCHSWGAIVMIALSALAILLNIIGAIAASSSSSAGEPIFAAAFGCILPVAILIVAARALGAMPKFLACPVWCQEALVSAKL